eukprot:1218922-Pyramimonas_sp.AAC.1
MGEVVEDEEEATQRAGEGLPPGRQGEWRIEAKSRASAITRTTMKIASRLAESILMRGLAVGIILQRRPSK